MATRRKGKRLDGDNRRSITINRYRKQQIRYKLFIIKLDQLRKRFRYI